MRRPLGLITSVIMVSSALCASAEPKWYKKPPSDTSGFMYARGYAEKKESRLAAIDAALQEALSRFSRRICVTIEDDVRQRVTETTRRGRGGKSEINQEESYTRDMRAISNQQLIGTDVVHDEVAERRGKWKAWIVASYPTAQYKKALARVPELVAERQKMDKAERIRPSELRVPLLVCPVAFGEKSAEQFPEVVARFKQKGYGNAIWQTVEDKLYDTKRFTLVTPPEKQMRSMLSDILGRSPQAKQKLPQRILLCNMNFFEVKTESLRFAAVSKRTEYHAELMLEYYNLEDEYSNVKIPAKGEAKDRDLLEATSEATAMAIDKLMHRIKEEEG
ncbi:MAG: LPP20 family lipoprotein [Kiritimatiellia bacterium]|nr:LPP20 family lipoprotein [Kiritimatiellia bacterium]MDP6811538.1 LPP20 family lipoprotein [Kiritimatiellia bacterium]MDP7022932.1 LPP20 family lipoprotein [Kiritimatiellia bacterium]